MVNWLDDLRKEADRAQDLQNLVDKCYEAIDNAVLFILDGEKTRDDWGWDDEMLLEARKKAEQGLRDALAALLKK
jgi:hypothetical protein